MRNQVILNLMLGNSYRRRALSFSRTFIQTHDSQAVHDGLSSLLTSGDPGDSMLVHGPSWVGKTASVQDSITYYPQRTKFDQDRMVKQLIVPILSVDSPPAPSETNIDIRLPRSILQAIHPLLSIGYIPDYADRLRYFFLKCETKAVFLDDINFMLCPPSIPRSFRAIEHAQSIFEKSGTKLVFAGTNDALELDLESRLGTKYVEMKPLGNDSFEVFLSKLTAQLDRSVFEDKQTRSAIFKESGGLPGLIVELVLQGREPK